MSMVTIPAHRNCPNPACAGGIGEGGSTVDINSTLRRRYYYCPRCSTSWSVDVRVVFESQNVIKIRSKGRP
jgi:hypothetical protein